MKFFVHMLGMYEQNSDQFPNKGKTSIFFSSNTPRDIQFNIIQIVGIKAAGTLEKYIGLPAFWIRTIPKLFKVLLIKHGTVSPIGKLSSYLGLVEKYSSKLYFNQFLHIL